MTLLEKLEAAAPKMLEALKLMASLPEENFHGCKVGEAIRAARTAIAQVEESVSPRGE